MSTCDSEAFQRAHVKLLGVDPGFVHRTLYAAFPKHHGYSSRDLDGRRFEATLMLALTQTFPHGEKEPKQVLFFVPSSHEEFAITEINRVAQMIFSRLEEEKRAGAAKAVGDFFRALQMGSRVFALPDPPERWAAFGFAKDDPIPEWMRDGLLDVEV